MQERKTKGGSLPIAFRKKMWSARKMRCKRYFPQLFFPCVKTVGFYSQARSFLFPIILRYAMIRKSAVFKKQHPPKQSLIICY